MTVCRKLFGIAISRLLSCIKYCKLWHLLVFGIKLLGNCNLKLLSCFKLLGNYEL